MSCGDVACPPPPPSSSLPASHVSLSDPWRQCLKTLVDGGQVDDADALRHDLLVAFTYVRLGAPSLWRHPTGTNSQAKVDSCRRQWGLPGGDLSAVMQSYRAWASTPKRERPQWCQRNCINPEAMSTVEDELLRVKREEKIVSSVVRGPSSSSSSSVEVHDNSVCNDVASRILLPLFFDKLCVHVRYSDRGAYMNVATGKPHRLYPESCLLLQGSLPEFVLDLPGAKGPAREYLIQLPQSCSKQVVYDNLKDNKTFKRDFSLFEDKLPVVFSITGVGTSVLESLTRTSTDVLQLRKQTARAIRVARELIGILPDKHAMSLKVCCPPSRRAEVEKFLGEKVATLKAQLEAKVERIPYPRPESGLRLLLGPGACVTELDTTLTRDAVLVYVTVPRDTRTELHDKLTETCVRRHFERKFGHLAEIRKSPGFPKAALWGTLRFSRLMDVFKAVNDTNTDGGIYQLVATSDAKKPLFNLRFTMRRRAVDKRKICVRVGTKTEFIRARYNRWYNEPWYMSAEFLPEHLMIIFTFNGTLKTLGQIAQTFNRRLHITPQRVDYWQQPPFISTPAELKKTRDRIMDVFTGDIEDYRRRLEPDIGPVDVVLETPRPHDMMQKGQVVTTSATIAGFLYQSGYITFYIGRRELNFDDKPFVAYMTEASIAEVIRSDINDLVQSLSSAEVKVEFKSMPNGQECVEVFCSYPDVIREACKEVENLLKGKVLGDFRPSSLQTLRRQTEVLKTIMTETKTKIDIATDFRAVTLHGGVRAVQAAEARLRDLIASRRLDDECWIPLTDEQCPRGLLQYMINRYGENLQALGRRYPGRLTLDQSRHAIHYSGNRRDQDRLQAEVDHCINALQENLDLPPLELPPDDEAGNCSSAPPETGAGAEPQEEDGDCSVAVRSPEAGTSSDSGQRKKEVEKEEEQEGNNDPEEEEEVEEEENDKEGPECAACLCPAEGEYVTLSVCGHSYCKGCFQMQLTTVTKACELPALCAKERCGDLVALDDIRTFCARKSVSLSFDDLYAASVESFLRRNRRRARPCPTVDCRMIYDVTEDAGEFCCPLCDGSICSRCHLQFHQGLSCEVVKVMDGINDKVRQWINEKPQSRKVCPSCHAGVEKWIGCDNVRCIGCGVYMCWRCLKYFPTEAECYVHMDKKHRF